MAQPPVRRRPKKTRKPTRDLRLLELTKLVKRHIPVTINGIPVAKIIDLNATKSNDERSQSPVEEKDQTRLNGDAAHSERDSGTDVSNTPEPAAESSPQPDSRKPKEKRKKLTKKERAQVAGDHIARVLKRDLLQAIYLSFMLRLAPDFPFDLALLNFNLTVPHSYPVEPASIIVLNSDIPRGFAINVERGFKEIARMAQRRKNEKKNENEKKNQNEKKNENEKKNKNENEKSINTRTGESDSPDEESISLVDGAGLLSQVQTLEKYLDQFLKQEKRQTMKFVSFKGTAPQTATPEPQPAKTISKPAVSSFVSDASDTTSADRASERTVSPEILAKRTAAIEQFSTKLSDNIKLFNKSARESRYKVNIPIVSPTGLPQLWTFNNKTVDIFLSVPSSYPEEVPKLNVVPNFSTNLVVAKKLALEAHIAQSGMTMVSLVEEAKRAEKNVRTNVSAWLESHPLSLVGIANWICANLQWLVLLPSEYTAFVENMGRLAV